MNNSPLVEKAEALKRAATPTRKSAYKRDPKHAGVPRTKLKRQSRKIVEVEKTPLLIAPKDLRPHPLLGRVGLLPEMISREDAKGKKAGKNRDDHKELAEELLEEFEALKTSIQENGILDPLKVVREAGGWAIADGRNRWEASRSLEETKPIPCVEITEAEVRNVILAAGTRRHMSKQARALMGVRVFPEVAEDAKAGRPKKSPDEQGISEGGRGKSGIDYPISQAGLAKLVGVGLETMKDACQFWRAISLTPKTRDERMNQAFAGVSFDRILQGDSSAKASKGAPRAETQPSLLLLRNANSMIKQWPSWQTLTPEARLRTTEKMTDAMRQAPPEIREAVIAAWETEA